MRRVVVNTEINFVTCEWLLLLATSRATTRLPTSLPYIIRCFYLHFMFISFHYGAQLISSSYSGGKETSYKSSGRRFYLTCQIHALKIHIIVTLQTSIRLPSVHWIEDYNTRLKMYRHDLDESCL